MSDHMPEREAPAVWTPSGHVCAVPVNGTICGYPVESEPCPKHFGYPLDAEHHDLILEEERLRGE